MNGFYITRDSFDNFVDVYPDYVGIRKFHGCCVWGAAWSEYWTRKLTECGYKFAEALDTYECKERFGFVPEAGTAWHVKNGKRTKVDIDFTN